MRQASPSFFSTPPILALASVRTTSPNFGGSTHEEYNGAIQFPLLNMCQNSCEADKYSRSLTRLARQTYAHPGAWKVPSCSGSYANGIRCMPQALLSGPQTLCLLGISIAAHRIGILRSDKRWHSWFDVSPANNPCLIISRDRCRTKNLDKNTMTSNKV
jgi:hypothetical protein